MKNKPHDHTAVLPKIGSIGISIWDPVWAVKDHVNEPYEIVHVVKGSFVMHVGRKRFKGEKGDTLIVPPHTKHRDAFDLENPFEVLHIQFDLNSAVPAITPEINRVLLKLSLSEKGELKEAVMRLYDVFRKNRSCAPQRMSLLLMDFLYCLQEFSERKKASRRSSGKKKTEQIMRVKEYIQLHLQEHIALKDIAAHVQLSEYYLCHLFSGETGFSFSEYLTRVRMERAAELLLDPAMRVSDVAYAAGYDDPNYFGKVFRKYHGSSPGAFRTAQWAKKRNK